MDSEYLKYLAKSKNLKLYEFEEKLGLSKGRLHKKLNKGNWNISEVRKIKEILEMSESDFKKVFDL